MMNQKEVEREFKEIILPYIETQYEQNSKAKREIFYAARQEAFYNYALSLYNDDLISDTTFNYLHNPY